MKDKFNQSKKLWVELYAKWANENDDISKWLVIGLLGILQMIPTMLLLKVIKYANMHDPKWDNWWLHFFVWTFGLATAGSVVGLFLAWFDDEFDWDRYNGRFAKELLKYQIPGIAIGSAIPAAFILVGTVIIVVFGSLFKFLYWIA